MQFASRDITTSSVTITWDNPPSCYTLTAIRVAYRPVNGGRLYNTTSFRLNKDVSLNALYRCTDYVMWISNIYDKEVSDPSEHTFTTGEEFKHTSRLNEWKALKRRQQFFGKFD